MFSCEYYEIFKNTYFEEQMAASVSFALQYHAMKLIYSNFKSRWPRTNAFSS